MPTFTTNIYIYPPDGEEHEITVTVDYYAINDPGDAWTPPDGSMTLNSIEPVGVLPDGVTDEMIFSKAVKDNDKFEDQAWKHYFAKGVDDD